MDRLLKYYIAINSLIAIGRRAAKLSNLKLFQSASRTQPETFFNLKLSLT